MKWPSAYRGWDDRRLPVKLAPTWWAPWAFRLGLLLLAAFIGLNVIMLARDASVTPGWTLPIMFVLMVIFITVGQRERFDRLVPTRLTLGLCPQCLYRLDNVPREEDNATVCPECGAAWVLPGKAKKG